MARRPASGMDGQALESQDIERRLRAVESNAPGGFSGDGETTYLRDRDLRVIGGTIRVEANGDIVIDGGQLVAGPTTVDASGIQVGSGVALDSQGLKIGGVLQPAIDMIVGEDASNSDSISTTESTVGEVVLTIPSFATVVDILAIARLQVTNSSGSGQTFENRVVVDVGGLDSGSTGTHRVEHNTTQTWSVQRTDRVTSFGSTITIRQRARATSGSTNTVNQSRLSVFAVARRVA